MDNKENLDLPFSEPDAFEPDAYPGDPYITRGTSMLNFETLHPLFAPDLPSVEDLGFSSELELALWLGIEADLNKPPVTEPIIYTLDTLPHAAPESMIAYHLREKGFPRVPFEQCVDKETIEYWNQFEDKWERGL